MKKHMEVNKMKFKLSNDWYDVLKWIALICIPALATFYVACAGVWGWPYADEIAKTANAVCVLLGALLGISSAQYYKGDNIK
jgi:hypothetical protein